MKRSIKINIEELEERGTYTPLYPLNDEEGMAPMIEWKEYGQTRETQPPSHVPYLISNGNFVIIGIHQIDIKSRVYRWFTSDGRPITGITHYAEINLPTGAV